MRLCGPWGGGSSRCVWGGRSELCLELLETGRPPGAKLCGGIRVRAPAGHPRPCRQAGDEPDLRQLRTEPRLSRDPTLPYSPTDLCVPSADCVPRLAITGPSGLGSGYCLQAVPETHFLWEPDGLGQSPLPAASGVTWALQDG